VEETKAGSVLTATSINTTSLAKADLWGGYIFGCKFSASATCEHGLNFQVCLVPKNQLGGGVVIVLDTHSNSAQPDALRPSEKGQKRLRRLPLTPLIVAPLDALGLASRGEIQHMSQVLDLTNRCLKDILKLTDIAKRHCKITR